MDCVGGTTKRMILNEAKAGRREILVIVSFETCLLFSQGRQLCQRAGGDASREGDRLCGDDTGPLPRRHHYLQVFGGILHTFSDQRSI